MQNFGGQHKYGDFSFESYKRMQLEVYLAGMEPFAADEPGLCADVSDRPSAFAAVRACLALPDPGPVDLVGTRGDLRGLHM